MHGYKNLYTYKMLVVYGAIDLRGEKIQKGSEGGKDTKKGRGK